MQEEVAGLLQWSEGFVEEAEEDVQAVVDGVVPGLHEAVGVRDQRPVRS